MMRKRRFPLGLYAIRGGQLQKIGSSSVELIEWTHANGTRTFLAPWSPR